MSRPKRQKLKENTKDVVIRARVDLHTKRMLEYTSKIRQISDSEVIRQGIEKIYNEIKK